MKLRETELCHHLDVCGLLEQDPRLVRRGRAVDEGFAANNGNTRLTFDEKYHSSRVKRMSCNAPSRDEGTWAVSKQRNR